MSPRDSGISARFEIRRDGDVVCFVLSGSWCVDTGVPTGDEAVHQLESSPDPARIGFESSGVSDWDSGLLTFLRRVMEHASAREITLETGGLPPGVQRLLALASAVPEREGARRTSDRQPLLERIGGSAVAFWEALLETVSFLGEVTVAFGRLLTGKARFRRVDLTTFLSDCGIQALPIVSLISLLVGLILAYVGAIQLRMFGAQIFVANLVCIGMVRALSAIMVAIVMAGRTGAAFAAQLGTMQVNDEIDAMQTLGVSPIEFLVLPRMLAMIVMMPLLCLYANLMGVLGGLIVGVGALDLNIVQYYDNTIAAASLNDLFVGLFMSVVFGVLVSVAGCMRGMRCGRSASAVGDATTSAVVTSIISVVVATAVITVICDVIGV